MNLTIIDDDGMETISIHHVYLLAGRFDWTDTNGKRKRGPLPHEFCIKGATPDSLYVRVDRPNQTRIGYANEVRLDRDFYGTPELTVDKVRLVPDAGFTLYVSRLSRSTGLSSFMAAKYSKED